MTHYVLDTDHLSVENLRNLGIRLGTMDLRIASIALSQNAVLLTQNISEVVEVPNLEIEDWTL